MKKEQIELRSAIVSDSTVEKIVETNSNKLTQKELTIAGYIQDLIASGKIGLGYQFGIKRFNSMFINWASGKTVEKATVLPTVKEITTACKSLYQECKERGFFPIVKTNIDGAIIIDCVKWVEGFYTAKKESAKKSTQKAMEIDYSDLVATLESSDTDTLLALKSDIERILRSKVIVHKKTA